MATDEVDELVNGIASIGLDASVNDTVNDSVNDSVDAVVNGTL